MNKILQIAQAYQLMDEAKEVKLPTEQWLIELEKLFEPKLSTTEAINEFISFKSSIGSRDLLDLGVRVTIEIDFVSRTITFTTTANDTGYPYVSTQSMLYNTVNEKPSEFYASIMVEVQRGLTVLETRKLDKIKTQFDAARKFFKA